MKYLLDTNIVSDLFDEESPSYTQTQNKLRLLQDEDEVYVSVLTLYDGVWT